MDLLVCFQFSGYYQDAARSCQCFLRHKSTLISPLILRQNSIPYDKACFISSSLCFPCTWDNDNHTSDNWFTAIMRIEGQVVNGFINSSHSASID